MNVVTAYIALGANLDHRRRTIDAALQMIDEKPNLALTAVSSVIETDPIGSRGQGRYLNGAAAVKTTCSPRALLETLLSIEQELGRQRCPQTRWGPRQIDLDLLLFGDLVLEEPGLVIPHPRLHERAFVLEPLAEIAPEVVHPVLAISIASLLRTLRMGSVVEYHRGGECSSGDE